MRLNTNFRSSTNSLVHKPNRCVVSWKRIDDSATEEVAFSSIGLTLLMVSVNLLILLGTSDLVNASVAF